MKAPKLQHAGSPGLGARSALVPSSPEHSVQKGGNSEVPSERIESNYLANALRKSSLGFDESVFIRFPDRKDTITYGEFFENASRIASVLSDSGLRPGDRVAVQVEKSVAAFELYIGAIWAGGVFVPLNPSYTNSEISYFVGDASPRIFVCDPSKLDSLLQVARNAGVASVLTLDGDGRGTLAEKTSETTDANDPASCGPDDLAAILYTSGTTGRPKGAMLSHDNLASNSKSLKEAWRFSESDALIHALPIFHTHGLFVATNVALMARSSIIFMPGFDAGKVVEAMRISSSLMGVPTYYTRLLEEPGLGTAAHGMRLFVSGSAPLLAATHELWREATGHAILERYGMTETSMISSNPYEGERVAGTVGKPLDGVEVRIVDSNGKPSEPGEPGSIEVRGRNVFKGYWRKPDSTAGEFSDDGFFITGDIGSENENGYISIIGRTKDLIICGGFNVYPKEIESLIDEIDGVVESAVVGVPHPDLGEAGVAAVVTEIGIKTVEIGEYLETRIARYKRPRMILLVENLPRNSMGKVQKIELRRKWANLFDAEGTSGSNFGAQQ